MSRTIFKFFKSKTGIAILVLIFFVIAFVIIKSKKGTSAKSSVFGKNIYVENTPEIKIEEDLPELRSSKKAQVKKTKPIIKKKYRKSYNRIAQPIIIPIDLYTSKTRSNDINPDNYAPFGRLVKCQLVITIDSSRIDTPIVAMVIEDMNHNGKVIIPAGTELHGTASGGNMRDRIASSGNWKFVWRTRDDRNGLEMDVKGLALDMEQSPNGGQWAITDGSAGLRGRVVDTTDWAALMAVAATFVSGLGEGMAKRIYTTDGVTSESSYGGTFNDALGKGLEKAAGLYAQQMLQTITRDGVYVRVPAGKQFYLYVQDTINLDNAVVGGLKIKNTQFLNKKRSQRTRPRRRL